MKKSRCWKGYEPVKGKKAYSEGSCKKCSSNKGSKSSCQKSQQRGNAKKVRMTKED